MKPICLGFNFQMDREKMRGNEKKKKKKSPWRIPKCKPILILVWGQNLYYLYRLKTKKCTLKLS